MFDTAHFRLKTWPFQPWSKCFFEALDPAVATQWADGKSHASTLDKNRNAQLITSSSQDSARYCELSQVAKVEAHSKNVREVDAI